MIKVRPQHVFVWTLFLTIIGFYTVAAVWFPMLYILGTYEDLFGEWIQFWSIVVALLVSVRLAVARWRFRWFFLLLALSCLYVAMEEISWGQRLVGFSSPDYFRAKNLQGETNIHNFLTGPYGTPLKTALTYFLATALAVYGLVYPAALRLRLGLARWLDSRGLAAPPLYLWPYFVAGALLECGPFHFNEAEVAEILIGFGLALTTVHYQFARRCSQGAHDTAGFCGVRPGVLALRLGVATVLVLVFSAATTTAVYASPSRRAKIDNRIDNGVEKFAGRYARYEQWETAVALYERVHEKEPHRMSIVRKLAECSRNGGDDARSDQYIDQALAFDLKRDQEKPGRASVNRSLARTYRAMGDEDKAWKHLQEALRIGLRRVEKSPSSASSAYSLGKTYSMLERHGLALEQLSRAHKLKPTSKKYRKAYYKARKKVS